MTVQIGKGKPREIDFEFEGKKLFVRKLPLSLGLKLHSVTDDVVPPEFIAEVISECVIYKDGKKPFSVKDVLEFDLDPMLKLFSEVTGSTVSTEEAEKN